MADTLYPQTVNVGEYESVRALKESGGLGNLPPGGVMVLRLNVGAPQDRFFDLPWIENVIRPVARSFGVNVLDVWGESGYGFIRLENPPDLGAPFQAEDRSGAENLYTHLISPSRASSLALGSCGCPGNLQQAAGPVVILALVLAVITALAITIYGVALFVSPELADQLREVIEAPANLAQWGTLLILAVLLLSFRGKK